MNFVSITPDERVVDWMREQRGCNPSVVQCLSMAKENQIEYSSTLTDVKEKQPVFGGEALAAVPHASKIQVFQSVDVG
jgi:hypothetical protein